MSESAKNFLDQSKPWRSDVRWWVVAAEAILLVAIGIFMLVSTDTAGDWLLQTIGLVFLVVSLQLAVTSFRQSEAGLGTFDAFRAGLGVTVGVISTSLWWSDSIPNGAVRVILGWGLVAYSVLQLVGLVRVRGLGDIRPATWVLSGLTLVLGILLLTSGNDVAESRVTFLGVVLLVFGLLLGALAYMIRSREEDVSTAR